MPNNYNVTLVSPVSPCRQPRCCVRVIHWGSKPKPLMCRLMISRAQVCRPLLKIIRVNFFVIAKIEQNPQTGERKFLAFDHHQQKPVVYSSEELDQLFSGELLLITYRKSLIQSAQDKFDIRWFIPSLLKYKKHFKSVIIASFFLQLFALVTPFFFQVVMDKVLVHKGLHHA